MKAKERQIEARRIIEKLVVAAKQCRAAKVGRAIRYSEEIRTGVRAAINMGMAPSEIRDALGIKVAIMSPWVGRRLSGLTQVKAPRTKARRTPQLRELQIVPQAGGVVGETVRVHLPNRIVLEIPARAMGAEFLKGLMELGAACS